MKTSDTAFLGVDIGTSSIAAVLVDGRGRALESRTVPNPGAGEPLPDGRHEQDADAILCAVNGLVEACETLARARGLEIAEIGWTGQMHGLVAVDRKLRALTPFVTWRDVRCAPPRRGCGVMADWRTRKIRGIYRALTIPGYVIARRTGKCAVDTTFRSSMGPEAELGEFAGWLPDTDDSVMLGDNQAGVYAAMRMRPRAAVVNIGTSAQLSIVRDVGAGNEGVEERPFPGGRTLLCRASHIGGASLAKLRKSLGFSWRRLNDEAATHPRIRKCVSEIVDDLVKGIDLKGVRSVVGVGSALRLNPCLRTAVEDRLKVRCIIPEVLEMAAWGAALYAMDGRIRRRSAADMV